VGAFTLKKAAKQGYFLWKNYRVRKIPDALREQMAADSFMKRCVVTGTTLRIQ
jgi:hypothetical protein